MSHLLRLLFITALLVHATATAQQLCSKSRPIRINPPTLFPADTEGFSQIAVDPVTLTAQVAGQTSLAVNMTIRGSTLAEQAEYITANLNLALAALEAQPSDVLNIVGYIVNYNQATGLPVFNKMGNAFQKSAFTVIGVQSLALDGILMEVEISVAVSEEFVKRIGQCSCVNGILVVSDSCTLAANDSCAGSDSCPV